jgi:phage terminase large subunit-like protein
MRYARGEISQREYEQMRRDITEKTKKYIPFYILLVYRDIFQLGHRMLNYISGVTTRRGVTD